MMEAVCPSVTQSLSDQSEEGMLNLVLLSFGLACLLLVLTFSSPCCLELFYSSVSRSPLHAQDKDTTNLYLRRRRRKGPTMADCFEM